MDAGVRWIVLPKVRIVAGLFDIEKPYYALDRDRVFGNLGRVRNRGVELSLAGEVLPRLNVVAGAVYLDAKLSGEAVEEGLVGRHPINSNPFYTAGAVEYRVPWVEGLALDVGFERTSDRVANRLDTFVIPQRYVVNPGFRYRFNVAGKPTQLRGQIANANNVFGFNGIGEGFHYNLPRRYTLAITSDL